MNIQTLEQEALNLPVEERARFAKKLLSSLDILSEAETEKLWLMEAKRRAEEIDQGLVELVSAEEMERRIQAILRGTGSLSRRISAGHSPDSGRRFSLFRHLSTSP